jgi:lycopene cyclase domain-containing protein
MYYVGVVTFIAITCLLLEIKYKEHLFKSRIERLLWVLLCLAVGIPWDMYSIPRDHWVFTGKGILGIYFYNVIPIEEVLWFLIVPYFFITIYKTVKVIMYKK